MGESKWNFHAEYPISWSAARLFIRIRSPVKVYDLLRPLTPCHGWRLCVWFANSLFCRRRRFRLSVLPFG